MIFDLSSPGRKNVVRVVFGFLALLFAVGFIFLGIGTRGRVQAASTRRLGGDNNSTSDAFEQQIEDAEAAVEKSPDDPKALSELVLLRTQSGSSQLEVDEDDAAAHPDRGVARRVREGGLRLAGLPRDRAPGGRRGDRPRRRFRLSVPRGHQRADRGRAGARQVGSQRDQPGRARDLPLPRPPDREGRRGPRQGDRRLERRDRQAHRAAARGVPQERDQGEEAHRGAAEIRAGHEL